MKVKKIKPSDLSVAQKDSMFFLMEGAYDNLDKDIFLEDLENKDIIFLLLNKGQDIVGFTNIKLFYKEINDQKVIGVFSGDTVISKKYRGGLELPHAWLNYAINLNNGSNLVFWFMLSKGYKTYRLLPRFFKFFYPHLRIKTPKKTKFIIDAFAQELFGEKYDSETNIYKPHKNYNVKLGKKEINENILRNEYIKFFTDKNKYFWKGEELVSYCEISDKNLRAGARLFLLMANCKIFMLLWRYYIKLKKHL